MDEMNIKNGMDIKNISFNPVGGTERNKSIPRDPISDFKNALSQSINELDKQMIEANQSTEEMLMGKKDIHQAMIAMERAGISLRLMIQVRNKILAAYEEIMRMQL